MKPCVIYTRISVLAPQGASDVEGDNRLSLANQKARLEAWAVANQYAVDGRHWEDAGISGRSLDNRPGAKAAIAEACRLRCPLVVYSLTRLCRSNVDCGRIAKQLWRHGADLVSLTEHLGGADGTAASRMTLQLMGLLGEFEADLVSERVTSVMDHMRRNQRRISGTLPLGWNLAADGRTLIPNEAEGRVLDAIRRRRDEGASLQRIADEMTAAQVPTKTGRSAQWRARTIMLILRRDQRLHSAA